KAIDNKYIVVFDAPKIIDKTDKKAVAAYIAQQTKILSNQYNVTVEREFGTALNGVLVDASKKQIHTLLS
ncbi:alkaline serine protease, partial [Pseudoalteromonas ruthenica]